MMLYICVCVCMYVCMRAKSLQSCLTLCDPIDCILPDSSVHGILQARILEWVAMLSSRGCSWPRNHPHLLHLLHWHVHCINVYIHLYIHIYTHAHIYVASQMAQWVKNLPVNAGDVGDGGSIPGFGRSPGAENGNPLP